MFGDRLSKLRTLKGLSREEFAKAMGISKQYVINLENNKSKPRVSLLIKISKFFNVRTNYLLGLDDIIRK